MVGVTSIQINESEAELKTLLQQSRNLKDRERLQTFTNFVSAQGKAVKHKRSSSSSR